MFFLVLAGGALQGYANGTADALFVALVFLLVGYVVVSLVFSRKDSELRAFLLSYAVCVLVGGLAQCYSLVVFGQVQSTTDAVNTFLPAISPCPPWTTIDELNPLANYRLAVVIWQQVYKLGWIFDWDFGPYTGVLFNALIMGLTASLTVATAKELFGNDLWRLRRVGSFFAFCGLFMLFGAVLLRDCFTTFLNAVVLWSLVRWLVRPTGSKLILAIAATGIGAWGMFYLREAASVMFGFFAFLAFVFYILRERTKPVVFIVILVVMSALIIGASYIEDFVAISVEYQNRYEQLYIRISEDQSSKDSLGACPRIS